MQLTAILLTICSLSVAATSLSQSVTYSAKDVKLQEVFTVIEQQTGFFVFFDEKKLEKANSVTINAEEMPLTAFLDRIMSDQPFSYAIQNTTITIKAKMEANLTGLRSRLSLDPPIKISGTIVGLDNQPLSGATIRVKGKNISTISDEKGYFELNAEAGSTLIISYVGYQQREYKILGSAQVSISLLRVDSRMDTAEVVLNSGYQLLPKERATGSFEHIDNEELNRRTGPDILSRIEGVTAGVLIDRRSLAANQNTINADNIIIRGLSTLGEGGMKRPLVVLNNFPYEGDINNINPNDVESITILKDAAAASIWGARAGNGVIVITTKKAEFNQPSRLGINTSVNLFEKPDLFHNPSMSVSEFIDVEKFLFDKGFYDGEINNLEYRPALTPVVDILAKEKAGLLSSVEATAQIDALRKQDVRYDFEKYIYRTSVNQQYSMSLTGGSEKFKYALSGGFDKNPGSLIGDQSRRITFRSDNTFTPVNNLEVNIGIGYANSATQNNSIGNIGSSAFNYVNSPRAQRLYPYAQFADENGNPLALSHNYRTDYIDTAGGGKLLDWKYRPLDEIRNADNAGKQQDILLNGSVQYKFAKWLGIQLSYQYQNTTGNIQNYYSKQTYYARNLINLFSQIENNTVKYIVPNNGILEERMNQLSSHAGRMQINVNKSWSNKHQLNAVAGVEIRAKDIFSTNKIAYGFNKELWMSSIVDHTTVYPKYGGLADGYGRIGGGVSSFSKMLDRFVSVYGNAAYTFNGRYTVSGSARRDAANLFGVDINNKWKPFWSLGAAWNISNESFYDFKSLPYLKFRITYGYQGNVNNSISPYTILSKNSAAGSIINQPYADIRQVGDPSLSWENTRQVNAGLDFRIIGNFISGGIEYYQKKSSKLIFGMSIDPTTGVESVFRNSATMIGKGIDITLNTININRLIKWQTNLIFSYSASKVTDYFRDDKDYPTSVIVLSGGQSILPIKGFAPYGVYSYPFASLDPVTGDPVGYLSKEKSSDYQAILQQTVGDNPDLIYHGPGLAPYYGNLNNIFSYKNVTLLINISYRFGFYFRKNTISYFELFSSGLMHSDFSKRWQKAGDETSTHVPSMIYPISDVNREEFYAYSSVNVLKGDHIRLDNINISYSFDKKYQRLPFKNVSLYLTATNLGLIWRANKEKLDPGYDAGNSLFPPLRSLAIGLKISL